jgi:hypothetical protein
LGASVVIRGFIFGLKHSIGRSIQLSGLDFVLAGLFIFFSVLPVPITSDFSPA